MERVLGSAFWVVELEKDFKAVLWRVVGISPSNFFLVRREFAPSTISGVFGNLASG